MAFQTCWRCLSRTQLRTLAYQPLPPPPFVAAFHTSASLQALPPKKNKTKRIVEPPKRGETKRFIKKNVKKVYVRDTKTKKPAVGERKALRKRIVLSNTNALEVQGIRDISLDLVTDGKFQGHVLGLPNPIVDQLRVVEAFKVTQGWSLYRRPCMLIRRETVEYRELIEEMSKKNAIRKTIRRVLVGERGNGKSIMLLQAMAMAFLKNWIVINLPDAQELVIGHTEYGPIPGTSPMVFHQKVYISSLLATISNANPILSTLKLSIPPPETPTPIPPSITLSQLCALGASDAEIALPIFQTLTQDLLRPSRPPVLLCLDGLAHAMKDSTYRDAAFKPIHAHDLYLLKWFFGFLSGASSLPNGGIVLAATSASNSPVVPALDIAIQETESPPKPIGPPPYPESYKPLRNPFVNYDQRVLDVFAKPGLEIQRLSGLTKDEARALMEYWARSGLLRQKVDEGFIGEKWTISGGGIVGELERSAVKMKI